MNTQQMYFYCFWPFFNARYPKATMKPKYHFNFLRQSMEKAIKIKCIMLPQHHCNISFVHWQTFTMLQQHFKLIYIPYAFLLHNIACPIKRHLMTIHLFLRHTYSISVSEISIAKIWHKTYNSSCLEMHITYDIAFSCYSVLTWRKTSNSKFMQC